MGGITPYASGAKGASNAADHRERTLQMERGVWGGVRLSDLAQFADGVRSVGNVRVSVLVQFTDGARGRVRVSDSV